MPPYSIRLLGDPVLKQKAAEIDDVDGALVRLADDMVVTLQAAAGLGLAAPQVGVQKRLFVYDLHDGRLLRVSDGWSHFASLDGGAGDRLTWSTPNRGGHGRTQWVADFR